MRSRRAAAPALPQPPRRDDIFDRRNDRFGRVALQEVTTGYERLLRLRRQAGEAALQLVPSLLEVGASVRRHSGQREKTPGTQHAQWNVAQGAHHRGIGFDRDPTAFRPIGSPPMRLTREQFGFRCDNGAAQLAAMRAGIGIAGGHVAIARRDPDLIRVLERPFTFALDMWLAMHRDARSARRIRVLFDHLAEGLGRYVAGP